MVAGYDNIKRRRCNARRQLNDYKALVQFDKIQLAEFLSGGYS